MKRNQLVGEICLYGTPAVGAGWLAQMPNGDLLGDGEPKSDRTFTEAIFLAVNAMHARGVKPGLVRVFAPGGQVMATTPVMHPERYGDLKWTEAIQYTIETEKLMLMA